MSVLGGSLLRVLKYARKGYRVPIKTFAGVVARAVSNLDKELDLTDECKLSKALTEFIQPNLTEGDEYGTA